MLYQKLCGLCGKVYLSEMPIGKGRLICDDPKCIAEYNRAAVQIEREEAKAKADEAKAKRDAARKERQVELDANRWTMGDRKGFVYLMRSDNGIYKIGRTKNIEARRRGIERDIPIAVVLVHSFATKDSHKAESYLHKLYSDCRIRYEWFDLSDDQVNDIKRIQDYSLDDILRSF